jgi:3-oxo-5-alpha-steroid 4-dehydrogenase 1
MLYLYNYALILIFGFAILVFILLLYLSAPYGKFSRTGWGLTIKAKWAWMIMEFSSPALISIFFATSDQKTIPVLIFVSFWLLHYIHRTFLYPFIQSGRDKSFPLILVLMAMVFNCLNGFANGYGVFHLGYYTNSWVLSWQFITGVILFISGFAINKTADEKLRGFRKYSPNEYIMPEGWLFKYISSPHYFGEIIEWAGWAVMTWSLAGLAFFIFTFANLFPRAVSSHRWYKAHFPGYPENRKAVIPFII